MDDPRPHDDPDAELEQEADKLEHVGDKFEQHLGELEDHIDEARDKAQPGRDAADASKVVAGDWEDVKPDRPGGDDPEGAVDGAKD
jgi:hypothetical protein